MERVAVLVLLAGESEVEVLRESVVTEIAALERRATLAKC
jgi:hypothetical protein